VPGALTDAVVDLARTGSATAFSEIYRELSPAVLGYLRGKNVDDPEAVTNDVFLAALPQLTTFTGGAADLRRFIFTIAHARMVDDTRRTIRRGPTQEYEQTRDARVSESAEDEALRSLDSNRLDELLEQLSAEHREVILLRLIADLSLAQVATVLGKSQGSVKQLQRRGLLALKKIIDASEGRQSWNALMTR
jgi:RNA polymerase sigma factor (sigma-70 family)